MDKPEYFKYRTCKCDEKGFLWQTDEKGFKTVSFCKCLKRYHLQQRMYEFYKISNLNLPIIIDKHNVKREYSISLDYLGKERIPTIAKSYIKKFSEYYFDKTVVFHGTNGTQKTTVSKWIGNEVIQIENKEYSDEVPRVNKVFFIDGHSLIKGLTDFNEERLSILKNNIETADLLILDEFFDPTKVVIWKSGFQIPYIDQFLRDRIEHNRRATIITMNIHPNKIDENIFGVSLKDLLVRNTVLMKNAIEFTDNFASLYNKNELNNIFGLEEEGKEN